jgi:predicted alpha/beta-fold hydrolase
LIINARDDPLSAFENAAQAVTRIPGAKLLTAATGGHLLLGSETRIREQVAALAAVDEGDARVAHRPDAEVPR